MSAPQVTPAMVEATIASEHYFTAAGAMNGTDWHNVWRVEPGAGYESPLWLVTYCSMVLKNGHIVSGEAYCADPAKFDEETGRIEARKAAINKLWPMVVYAERERLAAPAFIELKGEFSAEDIAKFKAYWERMVKGDRP